MSIWSFRLFDNTDEVRWLFFQTISRIRRASFARTLVKESNAKIVFSIQRLFYAVSVSVQMTNAS